MPLKISIIGKENVGKSTLFNKLCSKKIAVSHNKPGVTRDRKEYSFEFHGLFLELVDTAGWNDKRATLLHSQIIKHTIQATEEADLLLFVIDGMVNLTKDDLEFVEVIRKLNKDVLLLVNKSEAKVQVNQGDLYKLGLGEPVYISAIHNFGFDELYEKLKQYPKANCKLLQHDKENFAIAIVGKPNVGKSTLFNSILGFDRVVTSKISGTTRDAITYDLSIEGRNVSLIDTAGLRKKRKVTDNLEELFFSQSITAIRRANAVILVLDALNTFKKQDLSIAQIAINEGKILIIVVNKCDLIIDSNKLKSAIAFNINHAFSQFSTVPILYISAIRRRDYKELFKKIFNLKLLYETKINTSKLNKWLAEAILKNPLPLMSNGRKLKLKYVKQSTIRPPTFTFFTNTTKKNVIPKNYERYLENNLKTTFNLLEIPIRISFQESKNPYN